MAEAKDFIVTTALTPNCHMDYYKQNEPNREVLMKRSPTKGLAPLTFGIDLGGASAALAVVDSENQCIRALHVRTFDRAEVAKTGESLNLTRRENRLARRRLRRRAHRLQRLRRLMCNQGVVSARDFSQQTTHCDTWQLRADGLSRCLEPLEWARVLLHLIKHRGFQSNRKSDRNDEEGGKMLAGVQGLRDKLQAGGFETVGQLIAQSSEFAIQKRNKGGDYSHTLSRDDVLVELRLLFERQTGFDNPHSDSAFAEQVETLLMERRPTMAGDTLLQMVGRCTLEPQEFRAPKACFTFEYFTWLCKLNNLKISENGRSHRLGNQSIASLARVPFDRSRLTWKQIRAREALSEHASFNLVRYGGKTKTDPEAQAAFTATAFHKLAKAYKQAGLEAQWEKDRENHGLLDTLAWGQTVFKEDAAAQEYFTAEGVSDAVIDAALNVSFSEFGNLSLLAMRKMIPYLEQGKRYDEAALMAEYHHSVKSSGIKGLLPKPNADDIRNPVVLRAVNQARRLINACVKEYGAPAAVHIELGRDLSRSFEERRDREKTIEENRKLREKDGAQYLECYGQEPNGQDLRKWRFYRQQQGKCAYCIRPIDESRLPEGNYLQVDHVLPYSRSFDDSLNNKVLVHCACNQDKGNQTPFEMFGSDESGDDWQEFAAWVESTKSLPRAKRERLLHREFGQEAASEFRDRHLNDTRYIARYLKTQIEQHLAFAPRADADEKAPRCVSINGQLTALLRGFWGLSKVRADGDLHHALDAAVVACASASMVQRIAHWSKKRELERFRGRLFDPDTGEVLDRQTLSEIELRFPKPWPHFRDELMARLGAQPEKALREIPGYREANGSVEPVRVARSPRKRSAGQAHQETVRAVPRHLQQEGVSRQSVTKTPLHKLTLKNLCNISGNEDPRNQALITILRERLEAAGGKGDKAFGPKQPPVHMPAGKSGEKGPVVRSVKLIDTQPSGLLVRGGVAANGSMLRVDVFHDGKKYYLVPLYASDLVAKELPIKASAQGKSISDWPVMGDKHAFLFSLYRGSYIRLSIKKGVISGYFNGMNISTASIEIRAHDRNPGFGKEGIKSGLGVATALDFELLHVDTLGRLFKVEQQPRQPLV